MDFFASDPPRAMRRVRSQDDLAELRRIIAGDSFDEVVLVESHCWWSDEGRVTLGVIRKAFVPLDQTEIDEIIVHRFTARLPAVQ
jgi:hypothetical protein